MSKQEKLDKISREIQKCTLCKVNTLGLAVPGEGDPDADIVFLGEAPGKNEAKSGRPFIGRSGQLLRKLIRDAGLHEQKVYITSPVKYLPNKGTPSSSQIKHGKLHLTKQLKIISPKIIILLGSTAVRAMLEQKLPILANHGKIINKSGVTYMLTLHPAAVIRFPKYKKYILDDFQSLSNIINRT